MQSRFIQCFISRKKTITFHNVIILINPVFNKDKINNNYSIFLEKVSYELAKK